MKNKIILSAMVASTLFATTASALSVEERIAKLESIINAQQKEINKLKESTEDIEEMDERLETVETKSLTDKIKFGVGMRVEMNNYSNTYADDSSYDADEIYRTKLNLNMKAKIADNLKFTGRLSMYKNWGDSTQRNTNNDSMQGRKPDSSALYVERAYLDWTLTEKGATLPLIMTLGRQPSGDGPSYQTKENTTRKGTYDALAADGAADGVVLTALVPSTDTAIRLAYGTPNVLDNEAYSNQQMNYNGKDSSFKNTKVVGLFLDQNIPALPFDNLVQVYAMSAKDLNADPAYTDQNKSTGPDDINVGDLTIAGAMFEANKIAGKLDLFAHYARSEAKPNGKLLDMGPLNGSHGLLTSTPNDISDKTGHAFWLGTRFHINRDWKVGAEYNKGSQNWYSFTSGSNDPLNKLATRGDAVEVYVTKAINRYANLRFGYVDINYDYTGSGSHLGAPKEITSTLGTDAIKETENAYMSLNVLF